MQKMLKHFRVHMVLLCFLSLFTGTSFADELTVKIAFTFKEYYRWEGHKEEAVRYIPLREWNPYELHPDFLDIEIKIENRVKKELGQLKGTIKVVPMVGILEEDKRFGFDIDKLHTTASWAAVYLTDEFLIETLGPSKTHVKKLSEFNLKRLLDELARNGKWATKLKVEITIVSTNPPLVKITKTETLKITPPSE